MQNSFPKRIETPRLLMQAPEVAPLVQEYYDSILESYEELHRWYSEGWTKKVPSYEFIEKWRRGLVESWNEGSFLEFSALEKESGNFVGVGNFHHLDWSIPKSRIGYWVRTSETGCGYASEISNALTQYAFSVLKMKRLEIRVAANNLDSLSIPQKLGFQHSGSFLKNKVGNEGELLDIEIYARFNLGQLPECKVSW